MGLLTGGSRGGWFVYSDALQGGSNEVTTFGREVEGELGIVNLFFLGEIAQRIESSFLMLSCQTV
jgi:hypothetical protein